MEEGGFLADARLVLEFWKEFDFDGKRMVLDKQCVEMREVGSFPLPPSLAPIDPESPIFNHF